MNGFTAHKFARSSLAKTVMISNATSQTYTMRNISLPGFFGDTTCDVWKQPQHVLFQLANTCFCVSYLAPNGRYGILFLHALLILGFLLNSTWAWNVICAPDMFSWSFSFMILNMAQTMFLLYTMRQVKFPRELEDIYVLMFQPLQVPRLLFKKLVSLEYAQICNLHAGEAYAMQNLTKTDRLGLLIAGKVSVLTDHHFLHYIHPREFLDSPEFESTRSGVDDKFKVSILAVTPCRYLFWQRSNLEYLLIKEPQLATVVSLLIARDITSKLYAMNEKIVTEKGSHLDIRLPSVTGSMTYRGQLSSSSQANSITCSLNAYKYNEVYTSQQTLVRETKKRLRRSRKWKASSECMDKRADAARMDGPMDGRRGGCMDECKDGRTNVRADALTEARSDGRMDTWTITQTDAWTDGSKNEWTDGCFAPLSIIHPVDMLPFFFVKYRAQNDTRPHVSSCPAVS